MARNMQQICDLKTRPQAATSGIYDGRLVQQSPRPGKASPRADTHRVSLPARPWRVISPGACSNLEIPCRTPRKRHHVSRRCMRSEVRNDARRVIDDLAGG